MNTVFAEWAKKEIPHRYRSSLRAMQKRFTIQKTVLNTAKMGVNELIRSQASRQIVYGLYSSAIESMITSSGEPVTRHKLE